MARPSAKMTAAGTRLGSQHQGIQEDGESCEDSLQLKNYEARAVGPFFFVLAKPQQVAPRH